MGFTSDACWFLLIKTLLIKIIKREATLKHKAGGDEKRGFFLLGLIFVLRASKTGDPAECMMPNHRYFCLIIKRRKKNFPLLVEVRVVGFINDNDHHSLMFSPFCFLFDN